MPKATIPISIQLLAETDPSIQRAFSGVEQSLANTAKQAKKSQQSAQEEIAKTGKALGEEVPRQAKRGASEGERAAKKLAADAKKAFQEVQQQAGNSAQFLGSTVAKAGAEIRKLLPATSGGLLGGFAGSFAQAGQALGKVFQNVDFAQFTGLAEGLNQKLNSLASRFAGLSASAVVMGGAMSAALLGAAGVAVKTAAGFEQSQAKLETVLKSVGKARATMADAVKLAAKTPFDVEGLVTAAVQLEVYGNRSKETLPLVADLAAGMGKRIEDTALVVGKAMSGSLEGFESLRNEYGISTAKLARYGAVVDATGRIFNRTSDQIEKNRQALARVIATDFGGAVERQSKTFAGAMSNLSDAVKNLLNDFGAPLLGMSTKVVLGLTGMLELFRAIPAEIKQVIAQGAILTGMLLGMASATGALALGGLGAAAALTKLASSQAVTGIAGLSARLTGLAGVFGTIGGKATAAFAGITPAIGLVGIAAAALGLGLKAMADSEIRHQEELGEAIEGQAAYSTHADRTFQAKAITVSTGSRSLNGSQSTPPRVSLSLPAQPPSFTFLISMVN